MSNVVPITQPIAAVDPYAPAPPTPSEKPKTIKYEGYSAIFAPLKPVNWLVKGFQLAPGATTLFAGAPYAGKTLIAQDLAISVAAGRSFLGHEVRKGRVLHFDFEQGSAVTDQRYQRLGVAKGVTAADLDVTEQDPEGNLCRAIYPDIYLDDPGGFESYRETMKGKDFDLVILDSLSACNPATDENSAAVRKPIDVLNRISEELGVTIVLIHHTKKPGEKTVGGDMFQIAGSLKIVAACESAYMFSSPAGGPITIHHIKDRALGTTLPKSGIAIENTADGVMIGDEVRSGVRLSSLTEMELETKAADRPDTKYDAMKLRILNIVTRQTDGVFEGTKTALKGLVGGKGELFAPALAILEREGRIRIEGKRYTLVNVIEAGPASTTHMGSSSMMVIDEDDMGDAMNDLIQSV